MPDQTNTDKYIHALKAITEEQSKIVGNEIALSLAETVDGLEFANGDPKITGDPKMVLGALVDKYFVLFGKVSIDVSKEIVHDEVPDLKESELPDNLK